MGAKVAFTRPHLVEASHIEFVEAHKGVGPERRAVWVPGQIRGLGFPFWHEEVAASLP